MTPSDWITLSAVVVALSLGLWANFQTRTIQQRERKQRLLNEIIDWVQGVNSCAELPGIIYNLRLKGADDLANEKEATRLSGSRDLKTRSMYIKEISLALSQNLHDSVVQVLEALIKFNDLYSEVYQRPDLADEVKKQRDTLSKHIEETIKQATRLKLE